MLNVVLVAEESAGLQALRLLKDSPHRVVAVMAQPTDDPKSGAMWNHAKRLCCTTWPAKFVKQTAFAEQLREHHVDVLLNIHSLYVIRKEVLRACRVGAYNLHPGPLPERAGINVPSWSIYEGLTEHGVTLHEMVSEIDAGTIAYQTRFPIEPADTGMSLMGKCIRQGVPLIKRLLDDLAQGPQAVPHLAQDFSKRRYFDRSVPNDGWLDWDRPARGVVNHIRAADYSPFPSPWGHPQSVLDDRRLGFVKAELTGEPCDAPAGFIGEQRGSLTWVATADEWIAVKTVQLDGKYVPATNVLSRGAMLTGVTTPVLAETTG